MAISRKKNNRGQTALILILLSAAALIFLAITMNWGRISQTKTMLSIAADQAASLMASDAASYGEMQKQTNLQDTNQITGMSGLLFDIIMIVLIIIVTIITIITCGATSALAIMCYIALAAAIATATLQLTVIQPGLDSMWNKLQANQPIDQQFFEEAVGSALQSSITDQVDITDYFDSNANGRFGVNGQDSVSRFAFYYTERLKMLNKGDIPEVDFFYNQLNEFINGNTCLQNQADHQKYSWIPINPSCIDPSTGLDYCGSDPTAVNNACSGQNPTSVQNTTDPACTGQIPMTITCTQDVFESNNSSVTLNPMCTACSVNSADPSCQNMVPNQFAFQLNDTCTDSNPGANYNPYCDACCQPMVALVGTTSSGQKKYKALRPSSCWPAEYPALCATTPDDKSCYCTPGTAKYQDNNSACAAPAECSQNNPFNTSSATPYPYLYDPSYQEYSNGASFLDLYGRDQPMMQPTPTTVPLTGMTAEGLFPNGIYPFFWLMQYYSPQVDNLNINDLASNHSQDHWCVAGSATSNGQTLEPYVAPTGFSDLAQLTLSYACSGADCCVNFLPDTLDSSSTPTLDGTTKGTANGEIDTVGASDPTTSTDFGETGSGKTWLPGDNQMCMTSYYYNNKMTAFPDGTCEWTNSSTADVGQNGNHVKPGVTDKSTIDELDDVMHILSDFDLYSQSLLNKSSGTLSSTFTTWYPQVAAWIAPGCSGEACNPSGNGRLLSIYDPPGYPGVDGVTNNSNTGVDVLSNWNTLISNWLKNTDYSSSKAWCLPDESVASGFEVNEGAITPTSEDTYIHQNAPSSNWGDLAHVVACLNYNATQAANAYQACLTFLQSSCPTTPELAGTPCDPAILGRSLLSENQPTWKSTDTNRCDATYVDSKGNPSYAKWVNDNVTMFTDEAPKFSLRAQFLGDIYNRATNLVQITAQADNALSNFFKPCAPSTCPSSSNSDSACADGGPAAQLIYRRLHGTPQQALPNTVIYGWVDRTLPNGKTIPGSPPGAGGYAHIVKVTAYSAGRNGKTAHIQDQLPKIQASSDWFTQSYTLVHQDGDVYIRIRRWDQDHDSNSVVKFPNGHTLWESMFHNPSSPPETTFNPATCADSFGYGIGLQYSTEQGLNFSKVTPQDKQVLPYSFMLNDVPNGQVDTNNGSTQNYQNCLKQVNALLATGVESQACARYVAALNPTCTDKTNPETCQSEVGGNYGEQDYSIMFVDCNKIYSDSQPDDSF